MLNLMRQRKSNREQTANRRFAFIVSMISAICVYGPVKAQTVTEAFAFLDTRDRNWLTYKVEGSQVAATAESELFTGKSLYAVTYRPSDNDGCRVSKDSTTTDEVSVYRENLKEAYTHNVYEKRRNQPWEDLFGGFKGNDITSSPVTLIKHTDYDLHVLDRRASTIRRDMFSFKITLKPSNNEDWICSAKSFSDNDKRTISKYVAEVFRQRIDKPANPAYFRSIDQAALTNILIDSLVGKKCSSIFDYSADDPNQISRSQNAMSFLQKSPCGSETGKF